ncbi:MAG: ATP-binding protein [Gammaproteobacteria bacterium]|nr:ATP-binding protein [Gammaproteobacteria bacterium]
MNKILFPKPAPVSPMPLDKWLKRTDRAESGREAFFQGRDLEYKVFQDAVISLDQGVIGGGTMIFQGAPGAGKTALMGECMEAIRQHSTLDNPWIPVSISPGTLKYPKSVVELLISATNRENERLLEGVTDSHSRLLKKALHQGQKLIQEIQSRDVSVQSITVGEKDQSESAAELFVHASSLLKDYHIVVFVDEAQNVKKHETTEDILNCLHRDTQGIPLLTAFFGLSDVEDVLHECGLSRLPRNRVKTLGVLSHEESVSAIQSVFTAYDFKGSSKDQVEWLEALATLSQGWPQHINSVSVAVGEIIHKNYGNLKKELLPEVLELGKKLKNAYYVSRLKRCSEEPFVYQNLAFEMGQMPNGTISRSRLRKLIEPLLEHPTTFDDFLLNALHAGVLMEAEELPKYYQIPIPSLGDYLQALSLN